MSLDHKDEGDLQDVCHISDDEEDEILSFEGAEAEAEAEMDSPEVEPEADDEGRPLFNGVMLPCSDVGGDSRRSDFDMKSNPRSLFMFRFNGEWLALDDNDPARFLFLVAINQDEAERIAAHHRRRPATPARSSA